MKEYYSTTEVSKKLNIKPPTLLLYAREHKIKSEGCGRQTRYFWTETDVENYKKYSTDPNKRNHKVIEKTTNYNTLYVRLKRAKAKNDQARIEQYTREMEELLENNKKERESRK